MDKTRVRFFCSSSISNFKEKLRKRTGLKEYRFFRDFNKKVIFFGLYHPIDYIRFLFHMGEKTVFWCGGDILNLLFRSRFWHSIISKARAKHFCENGIEAESLISMDIYADIRPMIFDVPNPKLNFGKSKLFHVYMSAHEGKEHQYGVDVIVNEIAPACEGVMFHIYGVEGLSMGNVYYEGKMTNEEFTEDIKRWHCALRWNKFDGFSEVLAKALLNGHYAISRIWYPFIHYAPDKKTLINQINRLKHTKVPNLQGQKHWTSSLEQSLKAVIS